jgi:hypothetical protein
MVYQLAGVNASSKFVIICVINGFYSYPPYIIHLSYQDNSLTNGKFMEADLWL